MASLSARLHRRLSLKPYCTIGKTILPRAVCLPRFIIRQDVFLGVVVQTVDVVLSKINWLYPITGGINHHRDASTIYATRDQHRHQTYD